MRRAKKKKAVPPALQNRLSELEEQAAQMGFQVHYDLLEAAGLKLKGGICKIKGEYHLFIDRRNSTIDRIDILKDYLVNAEKIISDYVPCNEEMMKV
ncbi:MAG: hypothetical protein J7L16_03745 [Deltaproteobacteria bacterium]|nr:hypothetical protein [Deltaproteobacteria bacterium]